MPRSTKSTPTKRKPGSAKPKSRAPKRPDGPTPVTSEQFEILDSVAGREPHLRAFLAYIFQHQTGIDFVDDEPVCRPDRYVEIHHRTIDRLFRKADWKSVADPYSGERAGPTIDFGGQRAEDVAPVSAIQTIGHWAQGKKSRGYRLSVGLAQRLSEAAPGTVVAASATVWRNVWNGRRVHRRLRSVVGTSPRPAPALLTAALAALRTGVFDPRGVEEHLRRMRRELAGGGDPRSRARAQNRYYVDRACYQSVLRQEPQWYGAHAVYPLAYTVATTGWLYERGGGFQNASREMKRAAWGTVPGLHNLDTARAHLAAFLHFTREAGIPTPTVEALYADGAAGLETAAGLVRGTFKQVLYPLLCGGRLPALSAETLEVLDALTRPGRRPAGRLAGSRNAAHKVLKDATVRAVLYGAATDREGAPLVAFPERYRAVKEQLEAPVWEIDAWHRYLADEYVPERMTDGRGGRFIKNTLGMQRPLGKLGGGRLTAKGAARQVASHLLQGIEAAFTHALTVALTNRGVWVVSDEHDGLVVVGDVVPADVEWARNVSGFAEANLVEKPFAP